MDFPAVAVAGRDDILPIIATDRSRGWYLVDLGQDVYGGIGSTTVEEITPLDDVPVAATIPAPSP